MQNFVLELFSLSFFLLNLVSVFPIFLLSFFLARIQENLVWKQVLSKIYKKTPKQKWAKKVNEVKKNTKKYHKSRNHLQKLTFRQHFSLSLSLRFCFCLFFFFSIFLSRQKSNAKLLWTFLPPPIFSYSERETEKNCKNRRT